MKKMKMIQVVLCWMLLVQGVMAKNVTGKVYGENSKPLMGVSVVVKGTWSSAITDKQGFYSIEIVDEKSLLVFSFDGYITQEIYFKDTHVINIFLMPAPMIVVNEESKEMEFDRKASVKYARNAKLTASSIEEKVSFSQFSMHETPINKSSCISSQTSFQGEDYVGFSENIFLDPNNNPISTFSVDVDRASYANVRRYINNGLLPPVDAVRIEEMINYFTYEYAEPKVQQPLAIYHELANCPWNSSHYLLKVALKGKVLVNEKLPPSNLVFLIDVSGSMNEQNKLPLLKASLKLLVNELREEDKVSIVVYAGAAGVVLKPTAGNKKMDIISALDQLTAGGSTAGGEGLKLAYSLVHENFMKNGNNRIVMATDGDFNVGLSSNEEMERLIENERNKGVFITVAGFGMGNYKDSKMEIIADKGNGNYFYIDNMQEAHKAMVEEFVGTLYVIAKDVKFQLEFNPAQIAGYRLIGYENRLLDREDFNDDNIDAGDIGSGHIVTAMYEMIPVGVIDTNNYLPSVDPLKYQLIKTIHDPQFNSNYPNELLTFKLRYKNTNEENSILLLKTVNKNSKPFLKASDDFRFAASVAAWGMKLKKSAYISNVDYAQIIKWATASKAYDKRGYRAEMIRLMELSSVL